MVVVVVAVARCCGAPSSSSWNGRLEVAVAVVGLVERGRGKLGGEDGGGILSHLLPRTYITTCACSPRWLWRGDALVLD